MTPPMSNSAPKPRPDPPTAVESAPDPVFATALAAVQQERPAVLAAIVGVQGSSPREVGARMLVTADAIAGTVGGGVLEHMVIQRSRTLLRDGTGRHCLLSFPLGPDSQQCCGGVVTLFLEPLARSDAAWLTRLNAAALDGGVGIATELGTDAPKRLFDPAAPPRLLPDGAADWLAARTGSDARLFRDGDREFLCEYLVHPGFDVALFGAGHVGRAVAAALAAHRCRVLWIDPRTDEFPAALPPNARVLVTDDVGAALARIPRGALVLVMTHRHPLDYAICRAVLERGEAAFLGLIGSRTKRRRFVKALHADGIEESVATTLCCPIGIPGLKGKEPAVIAASTVAQLLMLAERNRAAARTKAVGIRDRDADKSRVAAAF